MGAIWDFDTNHHVIDYFMNDLIFDIGLDGLAIVYIPLVNYVFKNIIDNVSFSGWCNKKNEL